MPANANQIGSEQINFSLDQEFINRFNQEHDRLAEILGIVAVETMHAGSSLYQLKIEGSLNDSKTPATYQAATAAQGTEGEDGYEPAKDAVIDLGGSSGEAYEEGDLVTLSRFTAHKVHVGDVEGIPYRKQTTAKAIQEGGFVPAVLKTDEKMVNLVRGKVIGRFFDFLGNGTGAPDEDADIDTLQAALAYADAAVEDACEDNGDSAGRILHFVNRQDIAGHLAKADITTQTVYGMNYIESFLGVNHIFTTNRVAKGDVYACPAGNIRAFGVDFASLSQAGFSYTTQANGLIGVHHEVGYDRVSAYTNVMLGATLFAEVLDYIVKAEITPTA